MIDKTKIFEMLGIEPLERFYLSNEEDTQYFIDKDLYIYYVYNNKVQLSSYTIVDIFNGLTKIIKADNIILPSEQIAIDYANLCGFEWLAKNKNGEIYAYHFKPIKNDTMWTITDTEEIISPYNEVMKIRTPIKFLSWEDKSPYYIGD